MPKYRLLSQEELKGMEEQFIQFLAANGITGPDWKNIKANKAAEAQEIVNLFSDVVFESVLRKIEFLEHRSEKLWMNFKCNEDSIEMRGLKAPQDSAVDFTQISSLTELSSLEGIQVMRQEKAYQPNRNEELFKMTEEGCTIVDGQLFKALS